MLDNDLAARLALLATTTQTVAPLPPLQLAAGSGASYQSAKAIHELDTGTGAYAPVAPAPVLVSAGGYRAPDPTKVYRGPQGQPLSETEYRAMLQARDRLWRNNPAPAGP
jgi:hypothetical protein